MIGNSRIVAVSEAVHAARQPLEFRNRLIKYLVEEMGFTAIALESGVVEGRLLNDYVRHGQPLGYKLLQLLTALRQHSAAVHFKMHAPTY